LRSSVARAPPRPLNGIPLCGEEHEHQRATFAVSRTEIG
jgi:hypothetical protein